MPIEPGFHYDIPDADYHRDPCEEPSLSSGIARLLIERSPLHAWTAHPRLNPNFEPEEAKALDFGSAAHALILGKGAEIVVVDADSFRTKAAQEARDEARAAGASPILAADYARAVEMAAAFRKQLDLNPALRRLWDGGQSEMTIVWSDGKTWCRGRLDRFVEENNNITVFDLKTTSASAHPGAVSRRLFDMGQDFQQAFYRRGIYDLRPSNIRTYEAIILTQEIEPPYALSATRLDAATWAKADDQVTTAIAMWQGCMAMNVWPGYPPLIATAELPDYVERRWVDNRDAMRRAAGTEVGLHNILLAG